MSEVLSQARGLLEERLAEIDQEKRQLESALKELRKGSSPTGQRRRSAGSNGSSGRKRKRRKTSAAQTKAVTEYLTANPTASTAEVVQALGLSDGRVVGAQRRKLAAPSE